MKSDGGDLRVIELRAENLLRLHAVRIRPDGNMVEITGRNDQGKSSVINAIALAIGGPKELPALSEPLRRGTENGAVFVDLGELKITRTYGEHDRLIVEFADGKRARSPQEVLSALRGKLLDPLKFMQAKPADRVEIIKGLFPEFDFADNEAMRKAAYDNRTDHNRAQKRAAAARDAIALPAGTAPKRIDLSDVQDRLRLATASNAERGIRAGRRQNAEDKIETLRNDAERLRLQAAGLDKEADELEAKLAAADPLPDVIDVAAIMADLKNADAINQRAHLFAEWDRLDTEVKGEEALSAECTAAIAGLDEAAAAAVSGRLPFADMAISGDDITLNGIPFDQLAFSTRLTASAVIAIAMEPRLRVMLIREYGSLLDKASMAILAEIAERNKFQVWIESVSDVEKPGAVVIEDGRVKDAAALRTE